MPDNNIKFLRGSFAELNSAIAKRSIDPGAFYLIVGDAGHSNLYYGRTENTVDYLNFKVEEIENLKALPTDASGASTFYYAKAENAFVYYDATTKAYKQINPDTNTFLVDLNNTVTTASENGVTVTTTGKNGTAYKDETTWDQENPIKANFDIIGDGSVTVSAESTVDAEGKTKYIVKITGDEYSLASTQVEKTNADGETGNDNAVTIDLNKKTGDSPSSIDSSVKIEGSPSINVTKTTAGLQLSVNDAGVSGISDVEFINNKPKNEDDTGSDGNEDDTGSNENTSGFDLKIYTTANPQEPIVATLDPTITYDGETVKFEDGIAELNVYSKTSIDNKLTALNALHYKGIITTPDNVEDLPDVPAVEDGLRIGDVYKSDSIKEFTVKTSLEKNGVAATTGTVTRGDLIIANGYENTETGYITDPEKLYWDIVTINDEFEDTTYKASISNTGFSIIGASGADADKTILTHKLQKGNDGIIVEHTIPEGTTLATATSVTTSIKHATNTVTYTHDNTAQTIADNDVDIIRNRTTTTALTGNSQGALSTLAFSAIKAINCDAYGHIDSIETETIVVNDTSITIDSFAVKVESSNSENNVYKGVKVNSKIKVDNPADSEDRTGDKEDDLYLRSNHTNIEISASKSKTDATTNDQINFSLVWGSIPS